MRLLSQCYLQLPLDLPAVGHRQPPRGSSGAMDAQPPPPAAGGSTSTAEAALGKGVQLGGQAAGAAAGLAKVGVGKGMHM